MLIQKLTNLGLYMKNKGENNLGTRTVYHASANKYMKSILCINKVETKENLMQFGPLSANSH